jgi:hypothetical protein
MANKNLRYNPNSAQENEQSHFNKHKKIKNDPLPEVLNKDFNDKPSVRKPRDNT